MLKLVPKTRDEVAAWLDSLDTETRKQISADWWAKFQNSAFEDPWVHGFKLLLPDGTSVGTAGFKGPPRDGMVEIAYGIDPPHEGQGHATEAARGMVAHAFRSAEVNKVIAHTLPTGTASQRVLAKAGFTHVGEFDDPEDGRVWRFELPRPAGLNPWHAHVYYDRASWRTAELLHQHLNGMLADGSFADLVLVGHMYDQGVGPHPLPQFEIQFYESAVPRIKAMLAATGLTSLVHPLTLDDLADHTTLAQWIGEPIPLDVSVLDPPGINQGFARFGKEDF